MSSSQPKEHSNQLPNASANLRPAHPDASTGSTEEGARTADSTSELPNTHENNVGGYLNEPEFLELLPRLEAGQPPDLSGLTQLLADVFPESESAGDNRDRDADFVGRFRLLRKLGSGSFGVVYLAADNFLHREVALKLPRLKGLESGEVRDRFVREARAASALSHPSIVSVLDADDRDGRIYIATPFVQGPTLAQWLDEHKSPVNPKLAAALMAELADAVQHAHDNGILHRDIKPSNILLQPRALTRKQDRDEASLSSYTPKLCDFGLAKQIRAESDLTATGQILGTPNYMSPEQAAGVRDIGPAADIYALGAVLYGVLIGEPPFQAASTLQTIQQVVGQEPASLSRLNPAVDRDLETICLKCLQKEPKRRYESGQQLAEDLHRYLNGWPILARPIGSLEHAWRWCRRQPATVASILAGAVTLLTLFVLVLVSAQLNASRERAIRLEKDAELRGTQLAAAKKLAESQRKLAATQQYYASLSGVRERTGNSELGWAYQGIADLRTAASLDVEAVNKLELRNQAAQCVTGVDLQKITTVPVPLGYEPHLIAFRPDGQQLAIATLGSTIELCVLVCDVPSGDIVDDLRVPVTGLAFDGIRHLAYLGGGDEVAITTRSGWLHRWQLSDSPRSLSSIRMPRTEMKPFVFDGPRSRAFFGSEDKLHVWPDLSVSDVKEFHASNVARLRTSPDGRWLAACHDGVKVLDTRTGQLVQHIEDIPMEIQFGPDARFLASVSTDELVLADVETGKRIRSIKDPVTGRLHEDAVTEVTFSASGGLLMTSGHDQKFKIWDAHNGQLLLSVLIAGADEVRAAFSPDERYVAATGGDHVVLYALNGPDVLGTAAGQTASIRAFDVSRDPEVIFCSAAQQDSEYTHVSLWDLEGTRRADHWRQVGRPNEMAPVAISRDARLLAALSDTRHVGTWGLAAEQVFEASLAKVEGTGFSTDWMPAPRLLFQSDTFVRVVGQSTVSEPVPTSSLGLPWKQVDAAVNWGNGKAYFFRGDEFCEFDIRANRVVDGYPKMIADHWPKLWEQDIGAAVNYGGGAAYFLRDDECMEFRLASRTRKLQRKIGQRWSNGVYPANVDAILAPNDDRGLIQFFKGDTCRNYVGYRRPVTEHPIGEEFPGLPATGSIDAAVDLSLRLLPDDRFKASCDEVRADDVRALALSSDGEMLFSTNGSHEVVAWSIPDLSEQWVWSNARAAEAVGVGTISSIDAGTSWVVAGAKSKSIILFDMKSGKRVSNVPTRGRVSSVTLSDDETLLAGGTEDGDVEVAMVPSGKIIARLAAHRDEVTSLSFSHGGRLLATASRDKTIRLWQRDAHTFQQVLTLEPGGSVQTIRFVRGGEVLVASIKGESVLRVWRLDRLRQSLAKLGLNW